MDDVAEVMTVSVLTKVRDELVHVHVVGLERATRRQVEVANDFVDPNPASNVASFRGLFMKLLGPVFSGALGIQC